MCVAYALNFVYSHLGLLIPDGHADANLAHSQTITFDFTLQNRPLEQIAQTITLQSSALFSDTTLAGSDIMRIQPLIFNVASTGQTSHYPCAPNTISVNLRMNVPLRSDCRNSDTLNLYNEFPQITISGLSGARDNTISSLTSSDAPFNGVEPTFSAGAGTVTLRQASATTINVEYTFSFDIRNQAHGQPAPDIYVAADILSSSDTLMSDTSANAETHSMYM